MLQKNPDLAGIFGTNVFSAQGAGQVVANKGLSGKVKVVAFDATETAIEMLKANTVDMVIAQKPSDMGYLAVEMAVAYLDGATSIPKHIPTGYQVITRDNMDDPAVQPVLLHRRCPREHGKTTRARRSASWPACRILSTSPCSAAPSRLPTASALSWLSRSPTEVERHRPDPHAGRHGRPRRPEFPLPGPGRQGSHDRRRCRKPTTPACRSSPSIPSSAMAITPTARSPSRCPSSPPTTISAA